MKRIFRLGALSTAVFFLASLHAQQPISVGAGSYASYAPLSESASLNHGGCQAYQTEHRRLYLPDSLLAKLSPADGSRQGTLALPTNDWWTYALVNPWTGKIWFYPGWAEATDEGVQIGYPTYWEPTGCEVKWDTPLSVTFTKTATGKKAAFKEALVDAWSDFSMSFIMQDGDDWVRVTCMHGSPLVWFEAQGITMTVTNPDAAKYAVFEQANQLSVALLAEGLSKEKVAPYAFRIPRQTRIDYAYNAGTSSLSTTFTVWTATIGQQPISNSQQPVLLGFLPHHYYGTTFNFTLSTFNYLSPRGELRLAEGNDFTFTYPVHSMLPFFPAPLEWKEGFSMPRMKALMADYAERGTFGADTYWGGKGLTQMMHYMTFALQTGDTAVYQLAKQRLRTILEDWYTYTPGENNKYFARFPRFGALVGFDPSYDSDTFNDHHFHYGYFVYASAVLCMLDSDFKTKYGQMVREVAMDYANWHRNDGRNPWFRTLDPYCGHSFAGGMGNQGNGNGQESTSEAMQGWGGVWMLGAALGDQEMLEAGIFGYTLESRATAEYWFDRNRRNIDYTKYHHPYCCNLTMQGVGWWTWFSGDPVWMHSIQWLPTSPVLTNYLSEDLTFARWDYTQMYATKEVGDYEAAQGGLGDESGLGNVCLSYLALFDPDSAARVWDRMDKMGKALAKNPDTGGITYWLAHTHRSLGNKRYDIYADHPLACAYTAADGATVYAVYNVNTAPLTVHFFGAKDTTVSVPQGMTLIKGQQQHTTAPIVEEKEEPVIDPMAWDLPYPNLALHQPVEVSSFENAGCLAVNLTDGDASTRWGSAHADNEYAIVDLGKECYIDHLILRWEAAYASKYEIALSNDKTTWHTATLNSSGGVEKVNLQSAISNLQSQRGRYIRLTGLQRATQYGTSLYELEAYGRPLQGEAGVLFALALTASETVVSQGESTTLQVIGYDALGNTVPVQAVLAVSEGKAELKGTTLVCNDYGTVRVTATAQGVTASITIVVLESVMATEAQVYPSEVTMPLGTIQRFVVRIVNQFGASTDSCEYDYRATAVGDTALAFTCFGMTDTAYVHVLAFDQVNLALNKPATASGSEGDGTAAPKAFDGDLKTRWSSRFQDNEWLAVDLENCYLLTSVRLYWENAYATVYDIELSEDGDTYILAKAVTGAEGGVQDIDLRINGEPVPAQFVRILCKQRNTGYGASLWEMEVYGDALCEMPSALDPVTGNLSPVTHKILRNGHLLILRNGIIYNLTGKRVGK